MGGGFVSFVNVYDSGLGTENSKDTMGEFIACPGDIANGSLLLAGLNARNTPVIWLQRSQKERKSLGRSWKVSATEKGHIFPFLPVCFHIPGMDK